MAASQPSSDVEICNLALDYLNEAPITNIDTPNNPTAEICARWYHAVRRGTLRLHPWNFATKRDVLAKADVTVPFGYENAFTLPSDFVRLVAIGDDQFTDLTQYRYQVEDGYIYTSDIVSVATSLKIRYVYNVDDVNKFDALFVEVFVLRLAIKLARKFSASSETKQELLEELKTLMPASFSVDGQERPPTRIQLSKFISRRKGRRSQGYAGPYEILD